HAVLKQFKTAFFVSKISLLIAAAYDSAYDFNMKKRFSTPKIYDADGDITKRWYVYYSYRNPKTGKLQRQTPIYLDVNRIDNLRDRRAAIKILRDSVEAVLRNGHNPYEGKKQDTQDRMG